MTKTEGVMMHKICDWLGSIFSHGISDFENCVLDAVASRLTGGLGGAFREQVKQITSVQVDPFKTCFVLIMQKKSRLAQIETSNGLILAQVVGAMGGRPISAELGLCDGVLYAIVTNRPLSWTERNRAHFDVSDVRIFPRFAPPSPAWTRLFANREELAKIQISVLGPGERWLHPWYARWYLCMADIGSQYYVLQCCNESGELVLLDYIGDEIVKEGGSPDELISYAYFNGEWIDDKTPTVLESLLDMSDACADGGPMFEPDAVSGRSS